jgi:hypothetical protein
MGSMEKDGQDVGEAEGLTKRGLEQQWRTMKNKNTLNSEKYEISDE